MKFKYLLNLNYHARERIRILHRINYIILICEGTLSSRVKTHTWPYIYNYVSPYLSDNGQGIAIRRDRRCFNILVLCVFVYMRACPCD